MISLKELGPDFIVNLTSCSGTSPAGLIIPALNDQGHHLSTPCCSQSLKAHLVVFIFLWFFYPGGSQTRVAGIKFQLHTFDPPDSQFIYSRVIKRLSLGLAKQTRRQAN